MCECPRSKLLFALSSSFSLRKNLNTPLHPTAQCISKTSSFHQISSIPSSFTPPSRRDHSSQHHPARFANGVSPPSIELTDRFNRTKSIDSCFVRSGKTYCAKKSNSSSALCLLHARLSIEVSIYQLISMTSIEE